MKILEKFVFDKNEQEVIIMNGIRNFIKEEEGIGVVEIILILVVLIGLVIVFKEQLSSLVTNIFSNITTKSNKVLK